MIVELIYRIIPWWEKLMWRKWKYVMIIGALFYVLAQFAQLMLLGLVFKEASDNSSSIQTKHLQHVAVHKVLSKWEQPQHSKVMKDPLGNAISLRGTRDKDLIKYFPNSNGKFTCFSTKIEINFVKVNDDYCDCPEDGSDEPGTNACNNGAFYCEKSSKKFPVKIASYQVNDGVCDCCDGSDEWQQIPFPDANSVSDNRPLSYHVTECKNICTNT